MTNKLVDGIMMPLTEGEQADYDARNNLYASRKEVESRILATLAAHRYSIQTGGITVNGISVSTDEISSAKLTAAWIKAQSDPSLSITWIAHNVPINIDAATIITLGNAVFSFEQKCYAVHGQIINSITNYADAKSAITAFDEGMAA